MEPDLAAKVWREHVDILDLNIEGGGGFYGFTYSAKNTAEKPMVA